MSKKSEEVKNEVIEEVTLVPDGTSTLIPDESNDKLSLDGLLKLEKAANLVCIKYDKEANTYEQQFNFVGKNDVEYAELQKKYQKYNKIHSKIIDDIEAFIDEYFKED